MDSNRPDTHSLEGKTILLVNTGSLKKKFIVQRLKKLGLTVICLNKQKNWAEPYVDHWIISDTSNHHESLLAVRNFMKNHSKIKIDGAVTFWEDDVLLTSKIVDRFNFIGIPYNIAKNVRNKLNFRDFCKQNGLPAPQHTFIKSKDDLKFVLKNFNFPLVIKPAFGSSSAFVVKVTNKEDLMETLESVRKEITTDTESALTDGFDVFVEEYIDGDEVDIDIILQNGKIKFYSVADNYDKTFHEFFVDRDQAVPSTLPPKDQNALVQMAEETLEKLGIQNAIIHYEAKHTKNGPVPIEVNMRMGGDYIYSYLKDAWDVDFIEYAVKIAIGMYIHIKKTEKPKYIVGRDLYPDYSGILVELDIDESLKEKKYLETFQMNREIGDALLVPPEGHQSLGWITVSGDNTLDARDNLKEALDLIQYKIVKFDEESALGKTQRKNRLSSATVNKNLLLSAAKIEKVRHTLGENTKKLHIGIVGTSQAIPEIQSNVETIQKTLMQRGYRVSVFDFKNSSKAFELLKQSSVDLIINAYEGVDKFGLFKPQITGMLETLQIPLAGSSSLTLSLCQDKIRMKKLFAYHNLPTPKWDYAYSLEDKIRDDMEFPLIVKPGNTDTSFAITQSSVVKNTQELEREIKKILTKLERPVLVEEYIAGDEYDVTILGNEKENIQILPLSRSTFGKFPKNQWGIYTYDEIGKKSKNKIIMQTPPRNMNPKLESLITEIALDAYNIFHCNDYGRVELRVDEDDNPFIIRINANPRLEVDAPISRVAKVVGMNYGDLLEKIIAITVERYRKTRPQSLLSQVG